MCEKTLAKTLRDAMVSEGSWIGPDSAEALAEAVERHFAVYALDELPPVEFQKMSSGGWQYTVDGLPFDKVELEEDESEVRRYIAGTRAVRKRWAVERSREATTKELFGPDAYWWNLTDRQKKAVDALLENEK